MPLAEYYLCDKTKISVVGVACGTYGGTGEMHAGLWWGYLKERFHLEDLGVDGKIILEWIFKK